MNSINNKTKPEEKKYSLENHLNSGFVELVKTLKRKKILTEKEVEELLND